MLRRRHPPRSTLFPYTTLFRSKSESRATATGARSRAQELRLRTLLSLQKQPTRPIICCARDRKSTRLNSSHRCISYAVFCLKKKIISEDKLDSQLRQRGIRNLR